MKNLNNKMSSSESESESENEIEEIIKICHTCNKNININDDNGYMNCDVCDTYLCEECHNDVYLYNVYILDQTEEGNDVFDILDCNKCGQRVCSDCETVYIFDPDYTTSCSECITKEDLITFIDQQKKRYKEAKIIERLKLIFHEINIPFLEYGAVCQVLINNNIEDKDKLIQRVKEVHYLYNYCDIVNYIRKIPENTNKTKIFTHFQLAEYEIIQKEKGYPKYWPWENKKKYQEEKEAKLKPIITNHQIKLPLEILIYIFKLSDDKLNLMKVLQGLEKELICEHFSIKKSNYLYKVTYGKSCRDCKIEVFEQEYWSCDECFHRRYNLNIKHNNFESIIELIFEECYYCKCTTCNKGLINGIKY